MSLKEILEGLDITEDKFKTLEEFVNNSGKEKIQKANKEAENIRRRFKKKWEDLNLDPDSEEFEVELMNSKEKLKKYDDLKNARDKESETEISQLQRKMKELEETLVQKEQKEKELKQKHLMQSVNSALKDELSKNKALNPDVLAKALINDLNLDGEDVKDIKFKGDDGLSISDGVKKFLEENKNLVSSQVNPGGESAASKPISGGSNSANNELQARRLQLREKTSNGL